MLVLTVFDKHVAVLVRVIQESLAAEVFQESKGSLVMMDYLEILERREIMEIWGLQDREVYMYVCTLLIQ